ncbi:MAG: hypothetical protein ACJAY8_000740 [Sphingobacteriales bacterium]|jgi:hypothetical protein
MMMKCRFSLIILFLFVRLFAGATQLLVPMDNSQTNHLKAYGLAFWLLERDVEVKWLLNYRGGSFLIPDSPEIQEACLVRNVSFKTLAESQVYAILQGIAQPEVNQEMVKLEKVPKIAVYSPDGKQPWDDAVTLVLTYAEIPYERIYDKEIMEGKLNLYDWLHLHHEDFTGQYGKFYGAYRSAKWYQEQVRSNQQQATNLGFTKVSEMKRAVGLSIRKYVAGGGFLFTMCSGTDSFDISLAAHETDICGPMFDGDAAESNATSKLDFGYGFAFENYQLEENPMVYEFSTIDATPDHARLKQPNDLFTLFDYSAKWDVVPTMLTQSHERVVRGFMGQTTAFRKNFLKPSVLVLGETENISSAKYIHGSFGKGQWTYYGGHDPEDYRHLVGDPPTDLELHPNSPGYRLILNNVLFPAAKKKKQKT